MTRTRTTRYVTLLSFVLALALTAALAACSSDEPSGVTGRDRTASIPTETLASAARTPSTSGSVGAPTATVPPGPAAAAAPPAASPAPTPSTTGSGNAPTVTVAPGSAAATAPPAASGSVKTDREALVALYNATDGENWNESDNWLSDAPLGEWEGVVTNDDRRITELQLHTNDLSGEIPPELGSLSNLTALNLNNNDLGGEIPAELGSLSNLSYLYLNDNDLSGEIPAELGSLSNLEWLLLNNNDLSGAILAELGRS